KIFVRGTIARLDFLKTQTRKRAEMCLIQGCNLVPAAGSLLQHIQTAQAEQSIELWHAGIKTCKGAVVVAAIAVFTPNADLLRQTVIVGRDNAPFTSDEQLGGAEAIDLRIALRANGHTLIERAEAVRRIEHQL